MATSIERNVRYGATIDSKTIPVRAEYPLPYGDFWVVSVIGVPKMLVVHSSKLMELANTVPSRFSRKQFDRFAATIGEALKTFPAILKVNPRPLSVETFSARCRDAVTAKKRYHYDSPLINDALFDRLCNEIVIAMRGNEIWFGPSHAIRDATKEQKTSEFVSTPFSHVEKNEVELKDHSLLETVCKMLHDRVLSPAPTFFVFDLSNETKDSLERRYDIVISQTADNPRKFLIF